jgi:hypothetical protein
MYSHDLSWSEVDPARAAFDPETIRAGVRAYLSARLASHIPRIYPGHSVDAAMLDLCDDLEEFLGREYGRWTMDYAAYDLTNNDEDDVDAWSDLVVDALIRKRDYLEGLAQHLQVIKSRLEAARTNGGEIEPICIDAARQYVQYVYDWTANHEEWFVQAGEAIDWLVEALGLPAEGPDGFADAVTTYFQPPGRYLMPELLAGVSRLLGKRLGRWALSR